MLITVSMIYSYVHLHIYKFLVYKYLIAYLFIWNFKLNMFWWICSLTEITVSHATLLFQLGLLNLVAFPLLVYLLLIVMKYVCSRLISKKNKLGPGLWRGFDRVYIVVDLKFLSPILLYGVVYFLFMFSWGYC